MYISFIYFTSFTKLYIQLTGDRSYKVGFKVGFKVGSRGVVAVLTWVDTHGVEPGQFRGTAFSPNSGGLRSDHNSQSLRELWSLQNYILYYFNKNLTAKSYALLICN